MSGDAARLMAKVRKDASGCWEWTASKNEDGYGWFRHRGSVRGAHKCAYEILVGDIPAGLYVRHSCDNPGCVNPAHLSLGTQKENMRDCAERGRMRRARGSDAGNSKLTENLLGEVLHFLSLGIRQATIAAMFGVDQTTISCIKLGKTWRHVECPA